MLSVPDVERPRLRLWLRKLPRGSRRKSPSDKNCEHSSEHLGHHVLPTCSRETRPSRQHLLQANSCHARSTIIAYVAALARQWMDGRCKRCVLAETAGTQGSGTSAGSLHAYGCRLRPRRSNEEGSLNWWSISPCEKHAKRQERGKRRGGSVLDETRQGFGRALLTHDGDAGRCRWDSLPRRRAGSVRCSALAKKVASYEKRFWRRVGA